LSGAAAVAAAFQRRAERARFLAALSPTAAEPLRFAAGLYDAQAGLAAALGAPQGGSGLSGRLQEDLPGLVGASFDLLGFAAEQGPAGLAAAARERRQDSEADLGSRLFAFWSAERTTEPDYLSRAVLRPYLELLARLRIAPERSLRVGSCPFCGGAPWIAARRSADASDGAARFLGCALCGGEWLVARIRCPSCAEENPERLPAFQSDSYPNVRIEACEACRRYVKSIDLTLDGRAIPEVDDLVSLGMDLWIADQGFRRLEPGLAGI
jgi:FdhE protein